MSVIDEIPPIKEVCEKTTTSEWFDGEVVESIIERDKYCQSKGPLEEEHHQKLNLDLRSKWKAELCTQN